MAINFSDCDVLINGTGILATTASINQSASFISLSPIGYINSSVKSTDALVASEIQINYSPRIVDVNLIQIDKIKLNPFELQMVNLEIGGLKTPALLKSFSMSFSPNEPATANASFISFYPISGVITKKRGTVNYDTDKTNSLHAASVIIQYSHTGFQYDYGFSYSCDLEYQPIFTIGGKSPQKILFSNGSESISVIKEKFLALNFSGNFGGNSIFPSSGNISGILISSLGNYGTDFPERISIDFRDGYVTETRTAASVNNYLSNEIVIERNF